MFAILHFTFLLLVANVVKGDSSPVLICGDNEIYTCSSYCTETCDYKPQLCVKLCRFGCFCQVGYVRQSNDTKSPCIKREDCKKESDVPQCGENEEYQQCGSSCSLTCDDFAYSLPKDPKACRDMCKSGCFCEQGYYRNTDGHCVKPENCCPDDNEQYTDCGTPCAETCDYKSQRCTKECVSSCFSKSVDYIRKDNGTNSPCIERKECSINAN